MKNLTAKRLLTRKTKLQNLKIDEAKINYRQGDVVLALRQFSLTTNNITYAGFGDALGYWKFFPTGQADWGQMPVWGFAEIVHSKRDDLALGEKFYGYFPIASHIVMRPDRVSERGFFDGLPHREGLPAVYNQYTRCSTDPAYRKEWEAYQSLLRPLFITSYVLADFLDDNQMFGAEQILMSSASSKTAFGTAHSLKQINPECRLIGLTSSKNKDFVRGLGCYDTVLSYDDLPRCDASRKTLYVDFAGSETLRDAIHGHFPDGLVYDCAIGSAQTTDPMRNNAKYNPKPVFFFAPTQIAKRNAELGSAEQTRRMLTAQSDFFEFVDGQSPPWVIVKRSNGFEQARTVILELLEGAIDPAIGNIIEL